VSANYLQGRKVNVKRANMSSKRKVLVGFDYRQQKQLGLTRADWREELRKVVAAGGRRRHEHGETFGHKANGLIEFEIYDNVSL